MNDLYPWLEPVWQRWQSMLLDHNMPHAVLCSAPTGTGIENVVAKLVAAIVCKNSDDDACGFCHSCELSASGHHPDIHWVMPEKEGKGISVEQIRDANRRAVESSQLGGKRVIIINPAEAMNESASNALLKTLETPSNNCVFILLTQDKHKLLPTITSRCQSWQIPQIEKSMLMDWLQSHPSVDNKTSLNWFCLKMYAQSPVSALQFIEQDKQSQWEQLVEVTLRGLKTKMLPIAEVQTVFKSEPLEKLTWLIYLFSDIQKAQFSVLEDTAPPLFNEIVSAISYQSAYSHYQQLQQLHQSLKTANGLNADLLILDWYISLIEEQ